MPLLSNNRNVSTVSNVIIVTSPIPESLLASPISLSEGFVLKLQNAQNLSLGETRLAQQFYGDHECPPTGLKRWPVIPVGRGNHDQWLSRHGPLLAQSSVRAMTASSHYGRWSTASKPSSCGVRSRSPGRSSRRRRIGRARARLRASGNQWGRAGGRPGRARRAPRRRVG